MGVLCGHFEDFAPLASEALFRVANGTLLKEARRAVWVSIASITAELLLLRGDDGLEKPQKAPES